MFDRDATGDNLIIAWEWATWARTELDKQRNDKTMTSIKHERKGRILGLTKLS